MTASPPPEPEEETRAASTGWAALRTNPGQRDEEDEHTPAAASGSCPHTHTTGIHCPAHASHDLPHDLPDGCTDCDIPPPGLDEDGYRRFLRDVFDAYGAPLPDNRTLIALTEALGAAYGWGWNDGHDEGTTAGDAQGVLAGYALGYTIGASRPTDPEDNPQ